MDLTTSPEFMQGLRAALLLAAQDLRLAPPSEVDAENTWLTGKEAMQFLRYEERAFRTFKKKHPEKLVVSYSLGLREPRYQLASLQKLMLEEDKVIGLPKATLRDVPLSR